MLDHHRALIYTMVIVSAADRNMPDSELHAFAEIIGHLPIFRDFDQDELPGLFNDCTELIGRDNGLDETLNAIKAGLPPKLMRDRLCDRLRPGRHRRRGDPGGIAHPRIAAPPPQPRAPDRRRHRTRRPREVSDAVNNLSGDFPLLHRGRGASCNEVRV